MTRLTAVCAAGALALTASLAAQTPPSDQTGQYDTKKTESKMVTLTGCLAKGTGTDTYILSNVVVSPSSTTTPGTSTSSTPATATPPSTTPPSTMPSPTATGTTGATDMNAPTTWAVVNTSGLDLSPHVGHKVELTGTTSDLTEKTAGTSMTEKTAQSTATSAGETTKTETTMKSEMHSVMQKRLNVQSVKHVSATCTM